MNLKKWPKNERPREKLLEKGAHALSDGELLAIILRTGIKGKPVDELARELLDYFGSFRGLFHANFKEFLTISGLGPIRYTEIQSILEINKRYLLENIKRKNLFQNTTDTKIFLKAKLRDELREIFAVIFLDSHNYLLEYEEIIKGSLDFAYIYPREILKRVLYHNATNIIICHNHPSGVAEPSQEDYKLTIKIKDSLDYVDSHLMDHLIIAGNECFSFAEHGLL